MNDAVIVSTARTGIGKAGRGSLNLTHGATMGGHVAAAAVQRAGIDPALIEDSIWGCGYPEAATGGNIARQAVIRADLPDSIAGATVNRFCASGLQALAQGAQMVAHEGARAVLVGRPVLGGLAADGARGVAVVLRRLLDELQAAQALCGCHHPAQAGSLGLIDPAKFDKSQCNENDSHL